jgi:hypothetical protein
MANSGVTLPLAEGKVDVPALSRQLGRQPRVYLAGPMRGYSQWNAPAFDAAALAWRRAGWEVHSPVDSDRSLGVDPRTAAPEELARRATDHEWLRLVILDDVQTVCGVDAVALLPGWRDSAGATVEVALALFLGLSTLDTATMMPVYPVPRPWFHLYEILVVKKPGPRFSGSGCAGRLGGPHEYDKGGRCRRCHQMDQSVFSRDPR